MAQGLREVKRRIQAVQSTKKITRAMELIAASRVLKAQQRVREARPYAEAITSALAALTGSIGDGKAAPFLGTRDQVRNAAVVVITSDRGLAGPYSSNVLRQAEELYARLRKDGVEPKIYVTGRKGTTYYRFRDRPMAGSWVGFSERPTFAEAKQIATAVHEAYVNGEVDEVYIVSTEFVSLLNQRASVHRALPVGVVEVDREPSKPIAVYEFEPDIDAVLDELMPRYVATRIFTALLEAAASEQASRRRAMSTATENASNLIDDYTRQYNRARQAEITQELMEVVGAAEAFNGSK